MRALLRRSRTSIRELPFISKLCLGICLTFAAAAILSNVYVVSPLSSDVPATLLLSFVPLLGTVLVLCSLLPLWWWSFQLLFKGQRQEALRRLAVTVSCLIIVIGGYLLSNLVRTYGFYRVTLRSVPVIKAIEAYESKHGQAPPDLNILVPEFLPAIPQTGIGSFPEYQYGANAQTPSDHGSHWALSIIPPTVVGRFDQFLYLPQQDYEWLATETTGQLERIGAWGYIHD